MNRPGALILIFSLIGCGSIDPDPPADADGNVIVVPGAFDTYLGARADYRAELGVRPTLRVVFDGFIDEGKLLDFGAMSLTSGGIAVTGRVRWQMTTRTLEFRPFAELVPGLRYKPRLDPARLLSITGAPLGHVDLPEFLVVDAPPDAESPLPTVRWRQVDALLEAKCHSCHSDPQWQLNPLTRDSLVGRASAQTDKLLVVPFQPGDSYLMHKVLDEFPIRRFTVQPPPWSRAEPLTTAEVLLIDRWIATGARD